MRGRQRIIVSRKFSKELIDKIHLKYGHVGPNHILAKLRPFYYSKNLDRLVIQYCKQCETCIQNKTRTGRRVGPLSKLGPPTEPFEIMSIDTVGGFAKNKSPKKYLHILIDHFSRAVFITTSKTQNSNDIMKLVDKIARKQMIKMILTDKYPAMTSKEFGEFCRDRKIKLVFTPTNCASSNGLNERVNQTLVNRIRCKINSGEPRAWSKVAEECVQEYNDTTHSVTGYSPNHLLYGNLSPIIPEELIETEDLRKVRAAALENSTNNFERNKIRIEKNRKNFDFKVNDFVYVESSNKLNRNKLDPIRTGPFKILKRISNTIFELDHGKNKERFYHCSKLVPKEILD